MSVLYTPLDSIVNPSNASQIAVLRPPPRKIR